MANKNCLEIMLAAGLLLAGAGCSTHSSRNYNPPQKPNSCQIELDGATNYVWLTYEGEIFPEKEAKKYGDPKKDWKSRSDRIKIVMTSVNL